MNKSFTRSKISYRFLIYDICTVILSSFISLIIIDKGLIQKEIPQLLTFLLYAIPSLLITFFVCGIYRQMWQFSSIGGTIRIVFSTIVYTFAVSIISALLNARFELAFYFIELFLIFMFCWIYRDSRLIIFKIKNYLARTSASKEYSVGKKILFVGLEEATSLLIQEYQNNQTIHVDIIGVIEEDVKKHGLIWHGVKIIGGYSNIYEISIAYNVDEIVIVSPPKDELKKILNYCKDLHSMIKILPYSNNVDVVQLSSLRKINVMDLIGREEYRPKLDIISKLLEDKTILITGGGGSIGSELCRQVIKYNPKKVIIFDIYENTTYDLYSELTDIYGPQILDKIEVVIGSILSEKRLDQVFRSNYPDLVFHAAAYKHVPLMESNPNEAVRNNILGTYQVASMSGKYGVSKFLLISTDKAVNPTNVMGATKRVAEILIKSMNQEYSNTRYISVRFGNVIGSNGSVLGHFQRQIERGGPVTVTHPDITRYFMTISEAVSLVLEAMFMAQDGEMFILDMGEPLKIDNLARNMIKLAGLIPEIDVPIKYTGLRPGEKMFEEILLSAEIVSQTENKKIFITKTKEYDIYFIKKMMGELKNALESGRNIKDILKKYLPNYEENTSMENSNYITK